MVDMAEDFITENVKVLDGWFASVRQTNLFRDWIEFVTLLAM